ncbi:TIGR03943 family putative permease subunit [Streptomyces sp. N50]|uniref:TIGR03943 family putative permease subunit n=1 Tax=Streptomyces sp. N50 TaxID=3081765 RepID=UPI0029624182|nr:TIGR03943 family protein [Streptomyces sp. N50]WOX15739.1 TIGR03943 family protein [Streptomyces sp. N50]
MRRYGSAVLLLLMGGAVLRISLFSELYLRYVQPALRPYLVVSGALLILLGLAAAVRGMRQREHEEEGEEEGEEAEGEETEGEEHAHDHSHAHSHGGPRIAWLLTLPALALLLFPPPALGSYSASREEAQRAAQGVGTFPALPAGKVLDISVAQYSSRAIYDTGHSLKGRTLRMTGFVTHGSGGTWYLTRLLVTCCAADATISKVEIRGDEVDGAPQTDSWVTVTGTWVPKGKLGTDGAWPPILKATVVKQVKEPADPYDKR